MAEKLTEILRPKASSYKGGRKVYLVASMFGFQGIPDDLKLKLETYWTDVRNQIENLEQSLTKVTRVYHEGVFESGQSGLDSVNDINSYAHSFINILCKSTATLESLEDKKLVQEEYDWRLCSSAGLTSETVYSLIIKNLEESTVKRWAHASKVIDSTIPKDEAALLIVNENHKIQFPDDIQVFYISPPSFDGIKRWVDDQIKLMMDAQRESTNAAEPEPEKVPDEIKETINETSNKTDDETTIYPY
ncbi:MAG: hypothetical protein DK302_000469 [Chloroflexi bacterium]|nr:MAG: hypothetical protein DK302_000469 [Chloroflexota bacterium]